MDDLRTDTRHAHGPRERLAQHLCALLGSQRCNGCNSARSETCEGRRRLVVAAEHDGSGPLAPAARRGRLHGTGTSTSPAHATISVRRQEGGRRWRRARQRAFLSSKLDFARRAPPAYAFDALPARRRSDAPAQVAGVMDQFKKAQEIAKKSQELQTEQARRSQSDAFSLLDGAEATPSTRRLLSLLPTQARRGRVRGRFE